MDIKSKAAAAIEAVLLEYLSTEVVRRLKEFIALRKKALVVFSGALIGMEEATASLQKLVDAGIYTTAIVPKDELDEFVYEKIKVAIGKTGVVVVENGSQYRKLISECDAFIIPSLSANSAAKIASGIADSTVSRAAAYAIMNSKHVVIGIDGACPDNETRNKLYNYKIPESYKDLMRGNIEKIKSFGVRFTSAKNIGNTSLKKLGVEGKEIFVPAETEKKESQKTLVPIRAEQVLKSSAFIDKKVIGRVDIAQNSMVKQIKIPENAIITASAKELADSLKIEIVT